MESSKELTGTENISVADGDKEWQVTEMGERDQKEQTPSYEISKSWRWNVQHGDYS